jgi:hypothetical protein
MTSEDPNALLRKHELSIGGLITSSPNARTFKRHYCRGYSEVMDATEIKTALADIFDQALVFHAFAPHMRDYDLIVQASADPATGIQPKYLQYRFKCCVQANVATTVSPQTWAVSLDERLIDYATGVDLEGYVWGVNWQVLYPGVKYVEKSRTARVWAKDLRIPFHEVQVEMNAHRLDLVFSDLEVTPVERGYAPFSVGGFFNDGKISFKP